MNEAQKVEMESAATVSDLKEGASRPRFRLRFKTWQWALALSVGPLLVLWLILVARSLTLETATIYVTQATHGIAPPTALFDFGDLPRTAGIEHTLVIKNEGKTDTLVVVMVTGEINDFVTIDDSTFSLRPGEQREVHLKLKVPASAQVDTRYNGRAMIIRLPYWDPF